MSRIQAIDPATTTGRASQLLETVQKKLGMTPTLIRTMANQPAVLDGYLKFGDALGHGSFNAETREAIALVVAGANACGYCASAHMAVSKSLKVAPAEIEARLAGRSTDPKVYAVLAFARAVIARRGDVTDSEVAAVRAAGYDDGAIVEIVANVAINVFTNYLHHVAQSEIDFPVVRVPGIAA